MLTPCPADGGSRNRCQPVQTWMRQQRRTPSQELAGLAARPRLTKPPWGRRVSDPAATFATAGALFVDGDRIMPVHQTYGNGRDIPGGYAETGESPAAACQQEVKEELGLQRQAQPLLIVTGHPTAVTAARSSTSSITASPATTGPGSSFNVTSWTDGESVPARQLPDYLIPRLARRLTSAYRAHTGRTQACLEHGELMLPPGRARMP